MATRDYNPRVRHRHRKRRPTGGSAQENTHTRIWRDLTEGLFTWSDRLRLAKLYGSESPEFKRIQAWNHKHPYKKGIPGKRLMRR